jgi:hypothetical protein
MNIRKMNNNDCLVSKALEHLIKKADEGGSWGLNETDPLPPLDFYRMINEEDVLSKVIQNIDEIIREAQAEVGPVEKAGYNLTKEIKDRIDDLIASYFPYPRSWAESAERSKRSVHYKASRIIESVRIKAMDAVRQRILNLPQVNHRAK